MALITSIPMFFMGIILHTFSGNILNINKIFLSILQLISLLSIIFGMHFGISDAFIDLFFVSLIFSTQLDTGIVPEILQKKIFIYIGLWSYSIYMLHIVINKMMIFFWPKFIAQHIVFDQENNAIYSFCFSILLTIICAFFCYNFFEMPARKFIVSFKKP